ncbi:MAG TPA: hypothetical protein VGY56_04595 [Verrucomicrobiae bacterium]|nr:hypothetical protein [Verrucomicrobiae bacterium]
MKTSAIRFYASFLLIAGTICVLPRLAQAQSPATLDGRTTPVIGNPASTPAGSALATGNGPDDMNSSQLTPFGYKYVTYCPWVNQAVQAYAAANPAYTFTWDSIANPTDPFLTRLANDLSVSIYSPWVVNSPTVTGLDGNNRSRNVSNQDAGGSVFQFKYTPNAANNDPTSVRFIQAYNESFNGSATYKVYLDRGSSATPFYALRKLLSPRPSSLQPSASSASLASFASSAARRRVRNRKRRTSNAER